MTTIEKTPETSAHGDRGVKVRDSLIAGAQLQVALEKKRLGIPNPEAVKRVAEAK